LVCRALRDISDFHQRDDGRSALDIGPPLTALKHDREVAMPVDHLVLSRIQFAGTASFHIIFPCLIIGLAFYLTALELLWLKTKREIYRAV
jgi:hypothetical protein